MEIGISLGSNISNRLANLQDAKRRMAALPQAKIVAQSPVYETEPVGVKPEYQHLDFLNAILIVETPCSVHECFDHLRGMEDAIGRHRGIDRYEPRSIDLDIIYAGDVHIESGGLVIPHPHWARRRFVVQPLADVRPDLILPGQSRTVAQILADLPQEEEVTLLTRDW